MVNPALSVQCPSIVLVPVYIHSWLSVAEPSALRATKRLALRNLESPLAAALDAAALDFAALLRAGSAREGIAASRERRRPAWHTEVPALPEFD